ncbi:uncharacterized protein BCN122_III0788 [Burkholderia cenocepacia]|nr:uncharacterized protein BCN122_III0788 [Burkholderia cenocepacia]
MPRRPTFNPDDSSSVLVGPGTIGTSDTYIDIFSKASWMGTRPPRFVSVAVRGRPALARR